MKKVFGDEGGLCVFQNFKYGLTFKCKNGTKREHTIAFVTVEIPLSTPGVFRGNDGKVRKHPFRIGEHRADL